LAGGPSTDGMPLTLSGADDAGRSRLTIDRYRDGVKRTCLLSTLALLSGMTVLGCGASPSAAPERTTTSTTARAFVGTPLAWIGSRARRWNGRLNQDQVAVDAASKASSEEGADAYFGQLRAACTQMLEDATKAEEIAAAPSAPLDQAWKAMTADTQAYAEDCLTLARNRSNSNFTNWQNSVQAMDAANASLNTLVDAIRSGAQGTTGSGTTGSG
jgi:hypothetical protein